MSVRSAVPIAFFDVDETLLTVKSMVTFYDYFLTETCETGAEIHRKREAMGRILGAGLPRAEANRVFYRAFAGHEADRVAGAGQRWFGSALDCGGLFHSDVVGALHGHRVAGTTTVLVSGSFPACLDPVRAHLGADLIVCTEPEVRDGRYTGQVRRPMIGEEKAAAARELIARAGVDPADCFAYGDHPSDLELLRVVGHPVVVGPDPQMAARAIREGWARLAGIPEPAQIGLTPAG